MKRKAGGVKRSEYLISDLAALLLGLFLCLLLLFTAKYGAGMPDEGYYYTVAHRLKLGELMIADEWNLAQLVHLLNLLPNLAFMKLTGGTQGLILFMRYLFIGINTVFYGFVYVKLRRFRLWGALAAFLFAAVIQQTLLAIAYFTAAPMAFLAVWLLLAADDKKKSVPVLLLAGLTLACGILAEPFLILLYLLWFALTLAREKSAARQPNRLNDYSWILNKRVFCFVTLGAVAMFVPYMLYLLLSGSFQGIGAALPYLSTGAEYNKNNIFDFEKFVRAAQLYGLPFMAGGMAAAIAAAVLRVKKITSLRARRAVFGFACLMLAGSYLHGGVKLLTDGEMLPKVSFTQYNNLMLLLVSPVCWLLAEKKRPHLFALWLTGILFSALVDFSSTVILASGGGLIRVACVLQLSFLLPELRGPEKAPGKRSAKAKPAKVSAAYIAALALCGAAALAWNGGYVAAETVYKPVERLFLNPRASLSAEIGKGPFKGLYTTPEIARVYEDCLADLDEVKRLAGGRPAAVPELAPFTYLYLDLPYGAYSAWYEYNEPARLAAYWGLRPAQQPAVIYIPHFTKNFFTPYNETELRDKIQGLMNFARGTVIEGKAGTILVVEQIRFAETDAWQTAPAQP